MQDMHQNKTQVFKELIVYKYSSKRFNNVV